jgi:glyoxylase-like metal-dependent hydrolase (beta-lactamase superfamily II)
VTERNLRPLRIDLDLPLGELHSGAEEVIAMGRAHSGNGAAFARAEELGVVDALEPAWQTAGHGPRLRAIRKAGEAVRERIGAGPRVLALRTLPITTLAYPTKYAFWSAAYSPAPFVIMTHRALFVQFMQRGEVRSLLFNPTDHVGSRAAPFFARMIEMVGDYVAFRLLATRFDSLETQLQAIGVHPESIDYVAFDHFHTQDLRSLLGTTDGASAPRFPNAKLLAPRVEWDDWDDLHPMQRAWFVPDGKTGVRTERVVLTEADLELGDGVMLLRTPGHTSGNQTLFVNTPDGIWGCSENGTCADNWSPLESSIKGLAALCRRQDLDLVINANTPELGAQQYTSMMLERTIVDGVNRAPAFCQMFPSSEVTPSPLAPGLRPTIVHGALTYGDVVHAQTRAPEAAKKSAVAAAVE